MHMMCRFKCPHHTYDILFSSSLSSCSMIFLRAADHPLSPAANPNNSDRIKVIGTSYQRVVVHDVGCFSLLKKNEKSRSTDFENFRVNGLWRTFCCAGVGALFAPAKNLSASKKKSPVTRSLSPLGRHDLQ